MAEERKKILVVDDEAETRQFVQVALEDEGYALSEATDGKAALAQIGDERPDLIIMDVQMPKKDGFATFYELRHNPETKAIPVLFLTGVAEKTGVRFSAETVEEYMGERPEMYLDKPIDPEQLRRAVRQLLGG